MGPTYPPHSKQKRLDESPLRGDYDEHTDDVMSLLEENALLRRLLVKLDLVFRKIADRE